jgi:hypothetical protein
VLRAWPDDQSKTVSHETIYRRGQILRYAEPARAPTRGRGSPCSRSLGRRSDQGCAQSVPRLAPWSSARAAWFCSLAWRVQPPRPRSRARTDDQSAGQTSPRRILTEHRREPHRGEALEGEPHRGESHFGESYLWGRLTTSRAREANKRWQTDEAKRRPGAQCPRADPKVSSTAVMSEAGHHDRANRRDDAAAAARDSRTMRGGPSEVIAARLTAPQKPGETEQITPKVAAALDDAVAHFQDIVRNRPRGRAGAAAWAPATPPFTGEGPGGWSKPPHMQGPKKTARSWSA